MDLSKWSYVNILLHNQVETLNLIVLPHGIEMSFQGISESPVGGKKKISGTTVRDS